MGRKQNPVMGRGSSSKGRICLGGALGSAAYITFSQTSSQAFLSTSLLPKRNVGPVTAQDAPAVMESSTDSAMNAGSACAAGAFVGTAGLAVALTAQRQRRSGHTASGRTRHVLAAERALRPRDRVDGHGWIKEDPDINTMDESMVTATYTIELTKRPSGILRYSHGIDGKGAFVMDMHEKARYPGDPQGQAAVAGVKKGYVLKSVAGTDVRGMDFEDIMDMLEDYTPDPDVASTAAFKASASRPKQCQPVAFPVVCEFMEVDPNAMKAGTPAAPVAAPEGAWMPRLSGWEPADLAAERARAQAFPEPDASYAGPRYSGAAAVTEAWLQQFLEFQRNGGLLPKKDAYMLVLDVIDLLRASPTVVDVNVPPGQSLTVCGDLHGQYFDFLHMLSLSGMPSDARPFLFNGDFVDRGSWSMEVILSLFAFKARYPNSVFFNRGNHEMLETNLIYGFAGECGAKYDMELFNLFSESFRNLPLVHLVNNKVMVTHAGLPGPLPRVWLPGQTHDPEDAVPVNDVNMVKTIQDLRSIDRYLELTPNSFKDAVDDEPRPEEKWETDTRLAVDLLWGDPRGGAGYGPSYRKGKGVFMFGPDVTQQFVQKNGLQLVIRSHEVKSDGFLYDHPQLMTVFSAPNYLDTGGNKAAFLTLTADATGSMSVTPTTFDKSPHPDLAPMHYQDHIVQYYPHLTRQMRKKAVSTDDDFGDSDFAGYQGPDEWEEVPVAR